MLKKKKIHEKNRKVKVFTQIPVGEKLTMKEGRN
jgi:hypothetical protein